MQNSPSCKCCPADIGEGCIVLNTGWTEVVGDWDTSVGNTQQVETGNAILRYDAVVPVASQRVTVDVNATDAGNQGRIYLKYASPTDNIAIELEFGAGSGEGCGVFRLYNGATLIHNIPALGLKVGATASVTGYYDAINGVLWAKYISNSITRVIRESVGSSSSTTNIALGTGTVAGGSVTFDNIIVFRGEEAVGTGTGTGTGTSTSTGTGIVCPGFFDCDIHTITNEPVVDGTSTGTNVGCDATFSGTPFETLDISNAWTITSLINASDVDQNEDNFGLLVSMASISDTAVLTLTLMGTTATYTRLVGPDRTTIAIGSTTQTFGGHGLTYCLGIAGGVLSASVGGVGAIHVTPSTSGAAASATGTDGEVTSFQFSRCATCQTFVCDLCSGGSAIAKSVAFGFFTTGSCADCFDPPASVVLVNDGSVLVPSANWQGRTLLSWCSWGPTQIIAGDGLNPNCVPWLWLHIIRFTNGDFALMAENRISNPTGGQQAIWLKFFSSDEGSIPCGPLDNYSLPNYKVGGCMDFNNPVYVSSD